MDKDAFRTWRNEMGLSQPDAAKVLGVARRTIVSWESGQYPISKLVELSCTAIAMAKGAISPKLFSSAVKEITER